MAGRQRPHLGSCWALVCMFHAVGLCMLASKKHGGMQLEDPYYPASLGSLIFISICPICSNISICLYMCVCVNYLNVTYFQGTQKKIYSDQCASQAPAKSGRSTPAGPRFGSHNSVAQCLRWLGGLTAWLRLSHGSFGVIRGWAEHLWRPIKAIWNLYKHVLWIYS